MIEIIIPKSINFLRNSFGYTQIEHFQDETILFSIITLLFNLIISFYALYLSYSCSINLKTDLFSNIIFSTFAFIFGFFYLIYYFFINYLSRTCS
jgi:hypothetical protein